MNLENDNNELEEDFAECNVDIKSLYDTREDINTRVAQVVAKVDDQGLGALDSEEISTYKYYLTTHINKLNGKGEATKPIHINIADLVCIDESIFILNQNLYVYNKSNGTYSRDFEGKYIKQKIKSFLDREFIEERVISSIFDLIMNDGRYIITDSEINKRPKHWIHFINGYYDYKSDEFYPHDPSYNDINVIPWEYYPTKYSPTHKYVECGSGILREKVAEPLFFKKWLDQAIPDVNDQVMFLQYLGYAMTLDTREQKFLMVFGSGGTGKSTLLSLVEEIIGKNNISNISLQGLQERFSTGELYLKQANICSDIPLSALSEVDMIKKLTGEDTISAEQKFKNNFSFKSYARLFFSANDIPVNLSDKSNAFYRRMLILKMDRKPTVIDTDLLSKLREEIPNIISLIMEELYCSQGQIDESENSKAFVKMAHKNSDTVEAFLDDCCEFDSSYRTIKTELYHRYSNYCDNEGRGRLSAHKFYESLKNKGYAEIKGKTRDFVGLRISSVIKFPSQNVV